MSDAEAFMKIGEKFAQLEQRQQRTEQVLSDLITQITQEDKDGAEPATKANR